MKASGDAIITTPTIRANAVIILLLVEIIYFTYVNFANFDICNHLTRL